MRLKESVAAKVCCNHVQVVAMISGFGIRAASDNLGEFISSGQSTPANWDVWLRFTLPGEKRGERRGVTLRG